jgi:hypothetical protein
VRLADAVFRQGHLSEQALVEALMTGDRPVHLDRCDLCADRAVELGRWLDDVRAIGLEAADAAFPPEVLQSQQAQIMRRLEQLEQPAARVLTFPGLARSSQQSGGRRVAPGWVGVALAAGVVLGAIGGQMTARLGGTAAPPVTVAESEPVPAAPRAVPANFDVDDLLRQDLERVPVSELEGLSEITPRLLASNIGG